MHDFFEYNTNAAQLCPKFSRTQDLDSQIKGLRVWFKKIPNRITVQVGGFDVEVKNEKLASMKKIIQKTAARIQRLSK